MPGPGAAPRTSSICGLGGPAEGDHQASRAGECRLEDGEREAGAGTALDGSSPRDGMTCHSGLALSRGPSRCPAGVSELGQWGCRGGSKGGGQGMDPRGGGRSYAAWKLRGEDPASAGGEGGSAPGRPRDSHFLANMWGRTCPPGGRLRSGPGRPPTLSSSPRNVLCPLVARGRECLPPGLALPLLSGYSYPPPSIRLPALNDAQRQQQPS